MEIEDLKKAFTETCELLEYDPEMEPARPSPRKKHKTDDPPSLTAQAPPTSSTSSTSSTLQNSTELCDQAAIQLFVNKQINSGKWKLKRATAFRKGFTNKFTSTPDATHTYEFIIDGSERSCFDHKEVIKSAGFTHYSMATHSGWTPFKLDEDGKVKGFGRAVLE